MLTLPPLPMASSATTTSSIIISSTTTTTTATTMTTMTTRGLLLLLHHHRHIPVVAIILDNPVIAAAVSYAIIANVAYLARRAHIRKVRKRDIWHYRTSRVESDPWLRYGTSIFAWQVFVIFLYPFVEPISRLLFGHCSFMYDYPNARGVGYIFEPLAVQSMSTGKRTRNQLRFDWHAFDVNVGPVGRDGYRHPPCVTYNLPHVDAPRWGIKHWPWRRRRRRKVEVVKYKSSNG